MKVSNVMYLGLDILIILLKYNELLVTGIIVTIFVVHVNSIHVTKRAVYLNLHLSRCQWNWYVPFLMSTHKLLPMCSLDVQT